MAAWVFERAVRRGLMVTVTVGNGEESREFAYTYPMGAGQTAAKFKAAVRREVRLHLDLLNAVPAEEDVAVEYRDL